MSKVKKAVIITVVVLLLIPVILTVVITVVNDDTAAGIERELVSLPLPEKTVFVESLSKAGKLSGNGNGMQYLGVMLITSELSLEQLKAYYGQYDDCYVYEQEASEIERLHGSLSFKTGPVPENAYMVEMWGDSPSWFFSEFDIRGH